MNLKFGAFLAPFHALNEDPALSMWSDLDLIQWLDELGIDEAWVGEHHSGGYQPVASPELILAAAAERTRRIKLATGVVSAPYHHPFMVASRIAQLDQQSRGRAILGLGAGVTPADAYMLGIAAGDQRRMMAESVEAVVALLRGAERVTRKTDWFEMRDARLQVGPHTRPLEIAVAGAGSERAMRLAGQYGISTLTFGGRPGMPDPPLAAMWQAAAESAAAHGQVVDRANWRVTICVHLAEQRSVALDQIRPAMTRWYRDVVQGTIGVKGGGLPEGREADAAVEMGSIIVGTPDDAVAAINRKLEDSGGFGTLLVSVHDWATREQTKHSFELLARFVAPEFRGALDDQRTSQRWTAENRADFAAQAREAAKAAQPAN